MPQKAILIGVNTTTIEEHKYEMEELKNLCLACDIEVVDMISQNLSTPNPQTYVRSGKLEEIKLAIDSLDADVVVFNDELLASQINNINEILNSTIYDRTYVILEIFKRRAVTKEAIMQVDIASLRYMLPRLVGLREGLSRQRGAGGNGAHGRGQGETKLELDRRNINDRIAFLKGELKILTEARSLQRKKRKNSDTPIVSLVGYTNSGKSSTLNAIMNYSTGIKKEVYQKDMLFATLETASRLIKLENNHEFILTDTVGFVSKLPHHLVEAFKSTLEEITESDFILHVVDASNPNFESQIKTTNEVLSEIGVKDIPVIYVFNKIDLVPDYFYIPPTYENAIRTSTLNGKNIDKLIKLIENEVFKNHYITTFKIPYDKGSIVNTINSSSLIIDTKYEDDATILVAKVSERIRNTFSDYIIEETSRG